MKMVNYFSKLIFMNRYILILILLFVQEAYCFNFNPSFSFKFSNSCDTLGYLEYSVVFPIANDELIHQQTSISRTPSNNLFGDQSDTLVFELKFTTKNPIISQDAFTRYWYVVPILTDSVSKYYRFRFKIEGYSDSSINHIDTTLTFARPEFCISKIEDTIHSCGYVKYKVKSLLDVTNYKKQIDFDDGITTISYPSLQNRASSYNCSKKVYHNSFDSTIIQGFSTHNVNKSDSLSIKLNLFGQSKQLGYFKNYSNCTFKDSMSIMGIRAFNTKDCKQPFGLIVQGLKIRNYYHYDSLTIHENNVYLYTRPDFTKSLKYDHLFQDTLLFPMFQKEKPHVEIDDTIHVFTLLNKDTLYKQTFNIYQKNYNNCYTIDTTCGKFIAHFNLNDVDCNALGLHHHIDSLCVLNLSHFSTHVYCQHICNEELKNRSRIQTIDLNYIKEGFDEVKLFNQTIWKKPIVCVLGLDENINESHTFIYPNPSSEHITIVAKNLSLATIVDQTGKKIKTSKSKEIYVGDIKTGIYNLIIVTETNTEVIQLIKKG